jgi:hypothetical protein
MGDRDEPRTLFAWVIAMNGRENVLQDLVVEVASQSGQKDGAQWVALARMCDGLDLTDTVNKLEAAFDALGLVESAIRSALNDWWSVRDG